jgi:hypothetical protein
MEPTIAVENPAQMEGVVDVDAIPSPDLQALHWSKNKKTDASGSTKHSSRAKPDARKQPYPQQEVDEERTESDEPRDQPSMEKTQQEQIQVEEITVQAGVWWRGRRGRAHISGSRAFQCASKGER